MGTSTKLAVFLAALVWAGGAGAPSAAEDSPVGTWVRQGEAGEPPMTMTIAAWGTRNTRLIYSAAPDGAVATVADRLDGNDSPVLVAGMPTRATVSITLDDQWHATALSKLSSQPVGISKWAFSPDFETLTIEHDFIQPAGGIPAGRSVATWTRR
jgi:hypothetical protein